MNDEEAKVNDYDSDMDFFQSFDRATARERALTGKEPYYPNPVFIPIRLAFAAIMSFVYFAAEVVATPVVALAYVWSYKRLWQTEGAEFEGDLYFLGASLFKVVRSAILTPCVVALTALALAVNGLVRVADMLYISFTLDIRAIRRHLNTSQFVMNMLYDFIDKPVETTKNFFTGHYVKETFSNVQEVRNLMQKSFNKKVMESIDGARSYYNPLLRDGNITIDNYLDHMMRLDKDELDLGTTPPGTDYFVQLFAKYSAHKTSVPEGYTAEDVANSEIYKYRLALLWQDIRSHAQDLQPEAESDALLELMNKHFVEVLQENGGLVNYGHSIPREVSHLAFFDTMPYAEKLIEKTIAPWRAPVANSASPVPIATAPSEENSQVDITASATFSPAEDRLITPVTNLDGGTDALAAISVPTTTVATAPSEDPASGDNRTAATPTQLRSHFFTQQRPSETDGPVDKQEIPTPSGPNFLS